MRRTVLIAVALAALAAPAAALAAKTSPNDGVLVVKNAQAPAGTPAVVLRKFTGSIIGQTTDQSRIIIDAGVNPASPPEVTSADGPYQVRNLDTAQWWSSPNGFKFRAISGTFTILIYGSGINLVAVGQGTVIMQGMPDKTFGDGRYSINGGPFLSMPADPVRQLVVGSSN